jgi:prolipoprotein diacylglyceryltransferase
MAWYAIGRFLLGYLRTGDPSYAFALREDQVIGVLVLGAAIPMIVRLWPRAPRIEVVSA